MLRNPSLVNLRPRNASERALTQSTFHGRFAEHSASRHHRRHHHRPFVIGWVGPLFWPYAYYDFVDYTFYPHAYDTFWPSAYDDIYVSVFGRYAYGYGEPDETVGGSAESTGRPSPAQRAAVAAQLCTEQASALTNWPIEQIAQTVEPNEEQRAALDGLKAATAQALDILRNACPTDLPSTPTGRAAAMRQRLEVMLQAVRTIRPALENFYNSLNDEQKARFNALAAVDDRDPQQARRDLTQVCNERAAGVSSLPFERIEQVVRPDQSQRAALADLQKASAQAVDLLRSNCPDAQALTPVGRLQAMEQRLDAMLQAVLIVQPALERFYSSLSDEQKERFNRLAPVQG